MNKAEHTSTCLTFDDNRLLPMLFGQQDATISALEQQLGVSIASRGNAVSITGEPDNVQLSEVILNDIYKKLEKGIDLTDSDITATIRLMKSQDTPKKDKNGKKSPDTSLFGAENWKEMVLKTPKKTIAPFSRAQAEYLEAIMKHDLTFAAGPAGTGKTYFAVAVGAYLYAHNEIDRVILSRPAVEAGEKLGFLPGDMKEKVDPYLRPLYDALHDMMPAEKVQKDIASGVIEIAPLAFMRGRTLKHAFIILDEAQNVTPTQMKMFLTRMGQGSKMVITGDMSQTDLPKGEISGLSDAMTRLSKLDEVAMIQFERDDIVRHALTAKIIEAYEQN